MSRVRIISWNINSVRKRLALAERLLDTLDPDILCLQETKVIDRDFPLEPFRRRGYVHVALKGQKMHHGVATLSRLPLGPPDSHDWQDNGEARHVGVTLPQGIRLENVYIPAGGDVPDTAANPKFAQKLAFLDRMADWGGQVAQPTILLGDFNVAPLECDVWNHKALLDVVSHTPVEVERLARLAQSHGWVDLGRAFAPPPGRLYTWWSYRAQDWRASDRGRRLDHVWVSPGLAPQAAGCTVLEEARGWPEPSDHAPLIMDLRF